jgi:tRNA threonylcarbamoyladenosine biosynthesis protein TsaB
MSEPLTLAIDASTYAGTVAVISGAVVLAEREVAMRGEREERLMPAVADALRDAGVEVRALTRVVCGAGPGSFTSLRIAGSIAKGLCLAHGLPLFAVPSLALMAPRSTRAAAGGPWLAVLDAMRGDAYVSLVDVDAGGQVRAVSDYRLVHRAEVATLAAESGATVVGAGEVVDAAPRAARVASLAESLLGEVSLAMWEPSYGRLAEAQVKWEAAHGRALASG